MIESDVDHVVTHPHLEHVEGRLPLLFSRGGECGSLLTVNWSSASNPSLQMLTALDRSYHPACFVCSKCSKMLEGTEFLVTGEETTV